MAVNPRGGEGASKGSRYIPERLVGPGVITQNGYIDISKSTLYTGDVVPVPVSDGPTIPTATAATSTALGSAVPGTLLRFAPSGRVQITPAVTDPAALERQDPLSGSILFKSGTATDDETDNIGFIINFHSAMDPFFVVVPPGATHVRTSASIDLILIGVEVILDN